MTSGAGAGSASISDFFNGKNDNIDLIPISVNLLLFPGSTHFIKHVTSWKCYNKIDKRFCAS